MLGILARMLRRRGREVSALLLVALRFVLVVAGLGALVAAAWLVAVPLGLAAGGVALLLLEWMVKRQ
jgi:CHASE2 domain-containing sensor protein